jgi:glucose-6-phosphate isomerase
MRIPGATTRSWAALRSLAERRTQPAVCDLVEQTTRPEFRVSDCGLTLDFSRQQLGEGALDALLDLAGEVDLGAQIRAMFAGDPVNLTESRAALHVALRQTAGNGVGGADVERDVLVERERMLRFAEMVRSSGQFTDVINLGIGGSDLGPRFVCGAFDSVFEGPVRVHFVSGTDGLRLNRLLQRCNPVTTLFVICSKSFRTTETLENARAARRWVESSLRIEAVGQHFAAVSTDASQMSAFGVPTHAQFKLWDWVGGRFSVWSSVGLSIAIRFGSDFFLEFLSGAADMDRHFRNAPFKENMPILSALASIWNINFLKIPGAAIVPYSESLRLLPSLLQQLEMESCGKLALVNGSRSSCDTAPILWGGLGADAQHSFFQALHQGWLRSSIEFILIRDPVGEAKAHRTTNLQALAQIEALHIGQKSEVIAKNYDGCRPLSVLVMDRLAPNTIGAFIALWEHKVFCEAAIWGVNAFDQFGVELGKSIFDRIATLDKDGHTVQWASAGPLAKLLLGRR